MSDITDTIQTSHGECAKKLKTDNQAPSLVDSDISKKVFRRNWARLIQKVYHTDPLLCPKCNGLMRIISFIEEEETIRKILLHLDLWMPGNHDPPNLYNEHHQRSIFLLSCGFSLQSPVKNRAFKSCEVVKFKPFEALCKNASAWHKFIKNLSCGSCKKDSCLFCRTFCFGENGT